MHEMALTESIVEMLEEEGRKQGFARVRRVRLEIGALGHHLGDHTPAHRRSRLRPKRRRARQRSAHRGTRPRRLDEGDQPLGRLARITGIQPAPCRHREGIEPRLQLFDEDDRCQSSGLLIGPGQRGKRLVRAQRERRRHRVGRVDRLL